MKNGWKTREQMEATERTILAPFAQKSGGILRVHALDSPPSLSMHEEVDANPARAAMGIFNNLVMFDQHTKQNNMRSIIPNE